MKDLLIPILALLLCMFFGVIAGISIGQNMYHENNLELIMENSILELDNTLLRHKISSDSLLIEAITKIHDIEY